MTLPTDELIVNFQTHRLNRKQVISAKEGKNEKSIASTSSQSEMNEEYAKMEYVTKRFQKIIKSMEDFRRKYQLLELLLQMICVINLVNGSLYERSSQSKARIS